MPIAVYNNTEDDDDQRILQRFKEPAWNYQVVRAVDSKGKDLIPRVAGDWTTSAVFGAMTQALKAAKQPVPTWLQTVASEELAKKRGMESAIFGMS